MEIHLQLNPDSPDNREILMASMQELGYDSFWDEPDSLHAYILKSDYDKACLEDAQKQLSPLFDLSFQSSVLADKNWNKIWESKYDTVRINDKCGVRAPFHKPLPDVEYEIIIEPQMSFGTAHHETTAMILDMLSGMNIQGLDVLDMGSGTGVLAILAKLKGAARVVAVDYEEWAYRNTKENIQRNNTEIEVLQGDVDVVKQRKFDMILANINRNILIQHLPAYAAMIKPGGQLLLSGFYHNDLDSINQAARKNGFFLKHYASRHDWISALYFS
ncbi:MAG: 50S ribosomal protein L11 methyltransferase [Bacteroidales bacterium]